jgi:hypothetical protein
VNDKLHMMYVISDILVSDLVDDKRRVIHEFAGHFRDPGFLAVSDEARDRHHDGHE